MMNNLQNETQSVIDIAFKMHFQKLFSDYEKLQLEYSKLRKRFSDQQMKLNSSSSPLTIVDNNSNIKCNDEDLRRDLDKERLLTKSLNAEIAQIIKEAKMIENRYKDLLQIVSAQKDSASENSRLKELENENKELKETLEFLSSENTVLKDMEEKIFAERLEWVEEKRKYEEVVVWSKHINDKLKSTLSEKEDQNKRLEKCDKFLTYLFYHYCANQTISSDLTEEFQKIGTSENEIIEKKINLLENIVKSKSSNEDENKKNENLKNLELLNENKLLKEKNNCLAKEITELKKLLEKDSSSTDAKEEINYRLENAVLIEKLKNKEEIIEKLSEKFTRNRQVLEENFRRSKDEIKALDNFIAIIIQKLNSLPEEVKSNSPLKDLFKLLNENCHNSPSNDPASKN